jgi:hypothetical protein
MTGITDPSRVNLKMDEERELRYCSLEYRQQSWTGASARFRPVVLVVLMDSENRLRFLAHPALHTIIDKRDIEYVQSLMADFLERAKREPAALFKQLSSLGIGSLVTQEVGSNFDDNPSLQENSSKFVELK